MSQQPRRRRRRRRGRGGGQGAKGQQENSATPQRSGAENSQQPNSDRSGRGRRRRGRRRSRGGGERSPTSAKSSEDIVRAPKARRPDTLMLPPDDRRLEDIIGSLQSEMGVPQNPQEYRLTIKVAEERGSGPGGPQDRRGAGQEKRVSHPRGSRQSETKPADDGVNGKPKREKAPAAPRVGTDDSPSGQREDGQPRRRRSRRRRRGGRGRGGNTDKPQSG